MNSNNEHDHSPTSKSMSLKGSLRMFLGLSISSICIYYLIQSVEGDKFMESFKSVKIQFLFYALIGTFASYLLRTYRWKYFFKEKKFSFLVLYRALMLGFFMNNVLPARIGELVRCHSLGKRTGLSRAFVLATVAAERLVDGLTISAIFGIFFYFSSASNNNTFYIGLVALAFLIISLLVILGLLIRKPVFRLIKKLEQRINRPSITFILKKFEKFILGLEPLLEKDLVIKLAIFSIIVWSTELFVYYLITLAFNQDLGLGPVSLFLTAVNFASLIPAAPGGVGVIENFASLALKQTGLTQELALAMVIAQHSIQYIAVGIPGIYFVIFKAKDSKEVSKFDEQN